MDITVNMNCKIACFIAFIILSLISLIPIGILAFGYVPTCDASMKVEECPNGIYQSELYSLKIPKDLIYRGEEFKGTMRTERRGGIERTMILYRDIYIYYMMYQKFTNIIKNYLLNHTYIII